MSPKGNECYKQIGRSKEDDDRQIEELFCNRPGCERKIASGDRRKEELHYRCDEEGGTYRICMKCVVNPREHYETKQGSNPIITNFS
jgi:hypothetical protein